MESEQLLRALFVPGRVHDDFTFSPPAVFELVAINGVERMRGYYIANSTRTRTPFFRQATRRLRPQTVYEWELLTGERLTNDLKPAKPETERRSL